MRNDPEFSEALEALPSHASDQQLRASLIVLARIAQEEHGLVAETCDTFFKADPDRLLPLALQAAPRAGAPLGRAIERWLDAHRLDPGHAERLLSLLPRFSLVLGRVAVRLTRMALEAGAERPEADRAGLLNTLSNRLSHAGDRAGALKAIEEAVAIRRELAAAAPDAFRPDLALSLNNLSRCLSEVGDRAGALKAIEEAVAIRWELAAASPVEFRPALAQSLGLMAFYLGQLEQGQQATTTARESLWLGVELLRHDPHAYRALVGAILTLYGELCQAHAVEPDAQVLETIAAQPPEADE